MKNIYSSYFLFLIISVALFFVSGVRANCPELHISDVSKLLASKEIVVDQKHSQSEFVLNFKAASDTSWSVKGSEAAAVTIFINNTYHQDIYLFGGKQRFEYKALLGNLPIGKNNVRIFLNENLSASGAKNIKVNGLSIKAAKAVTPDDQLALKFAPMIYARPETIGKFSDIPLLTYYEIFRSNDGVTKIRYTTIFSNEDGGTPTAALMARWGRLTDIEWVYEIDIKDNKPISQIFQGANHVTTDFRGTTVFGSHPVIYNTTVNNNFADKGCSSMRTMMLPIKADLSSSSRETVMDANHFTYQIMAAEAVREKRIDPQNMDINRIDRLQNYIYVEVFSDNKDAAIYIELESSDGKMSHSDLGEHRLRAELSGYKRIAVRMPSDKPLSEIRAVCKKDPRRETGECTDVRLLKYIKLQDNYIPYVISNMNAASNDLSDGGSVKWVLKE